MTLGRAGSSCVVNFYTWQADALVLLVARIPDSVEYAGVLKLSMINQRKNVPLNDQ